MSILLGYSHGPEAPSRRSRVQEKTNRRHQEVSSMSRSKIASVGMLIAYVALGLALGGCIFISG